MENWADNLIREYAAGREQLGRLKEYLDKDNPVDEQDIKQINSMIESMSFAIEWMETGKQPGTFRGIDKRGIYQRQYFESIEVIPDIMEQLDINNKKLYLTREEKLILADIFASLSLRERQCFILYTAQGMSMGKIAEVVGVSKATVQSYITRAKKKVVERVY
ncbi:sigma-70 family RNA polymerase sigma factor [Psychrobacillus sp. FSL K6-1267]|uniref:sigma-70 family RNA polymerase sigma factor n=1 Tax=Psychrobacillus sp. FSL K6-1267 TaxID=2921543 RepID=UPI0030FCEB34